MTSGGPRLTVGLPVRNGARFLEARLADLWAQGIEDMRVVISDNASTDGTSDLAAAAARADERVVHRRQARDVGANANFNAAFVGCASPYFAWAAVDDLGEAGLLGAGVDALDGDPSAVLAYGYPRLIDEHGFALAEVLEDEPRATAADAVGRFADVLAHEVWCTPIFGVVRSATLARTARLRPFYGADKVLLAELSLAGRFTRVDHAFLRRCHPDQSTVLDARAQAVWTTGRARPGRVPAVVEATAAYARLAWGAELTIPDRARALAAVAALAAGGDKWRKLVLPGPYNYLGWTGGRAGAAAYADVDLRPLGPASVQSDRSTAACRTTGPAPDRTGAGSGAGADGR